jgi:hypothetical protein
MVEISALFGLTLLLAAALAYVAIRSPQKVWVKSAALAVVALFLPLVYASFSELLGRAKPVHLEWTNMNVAEAEVLASRLDEKRAIYVWLMLPDAESPRAYALAWNEDLAKQLNEAQSQAEERGQGMRMRFPFGSSALTSEERTFYAPPPQSLPPKQTGHDRQDRSSVRAGMYSDPASDARNAP